jgi:hypothetical protein
MHYNKQARKWEFILIELFAFHQYYFDSFLKVNLSLYRPVEALRVARS